MWFDSIPFIRDKSTTMVYSKHWPNYGSTTPTWLSSSISSSPTAIQRVWYLTHFNTDAYFVNNYSLFHCFRFPSSSIWLRICIKKGRLKIWRNGPMRFTLLTLFLMRLVSAAKFYLNQKLISISRMIWQPLKVNNIDEHVLHEIDDALQIDLDKEEILRKVTTVFFTYSSQSSQFSVYLFMLKRFTYRFIKRFFKILLDSIKFFFICLLFCELCVESF